MSSKQSEDECAYIPFQNLYKLMRNISINHFYHIKVSAMTNLHMYHRHSYQAITQSSQTKL